jgi:hypothetical protein
VSCIGVEVRGKRQAAGEKRTDVAKQDVQKNHASRLTTLTVTKPPAGEQTVKHSPSSSIRNLTPHPDQ